MYRSVEVKEFVYRDYLDSERGNFSLGCSARSEGDRVLKSRHRFYGYAGSSSKACKKRSEVRVRYLRGY
jgi:hypothetical protein